MENLKREANENLRRLAENAYPGRGIVLGQGLDGKLVQIYWIMGRSENSRNRVFVREGKTVRTEPCDGSSMTDPSLVIYTAMNEVDGHYLVSNGDHTDTMCDVLRAGGGYREALDQCSHEPDEPHYTPRIAGGLRLDAGAAAAWLAIIRANPFDKERSDHAYFEYSRFAPGFGWCVTTYRGDGTPLPAFVGEPVLLPLLGGGEELATWMWYRLNENNRISLALKVIDPDSGESETRIINKFA